MLQKFMFERNSEAPLLYDIARQKKTQFQITIPKAVYRAAFDQFSPEVLKKHFEIGKCITYAEQENNCTLSFDVSMYYGFIMRGLNNVFIILNNDKHFEFADREGRQMMTCLVASTALAVSYAPWVLEHFKNKECAPYLFSYAETQIKEIQDILLKKMKDNGYTRCSYWDDGFQFNLFGNGLCFEGNYKDNVFDTHNCDTHIDQTIFFTGCVALCDALKHYLKTGNYLT